MSTITPLPLDSPGPHRTPHADSSEILHTIEVTPLPERWTSLPWCVVWAIWSVGTRAEQAERLTRRVADHCMVTEPVTASPTLLAVDDIDLTMFTEFFPDEATLIEIANAQRVWTRRDAPTKATTALGWVKVLADHDVLDLYRAMQALDDPRHYAQVHAALGKVPGDRSGIRRCAFWTAVAADHQVRPDAHNARWLQDRLMASEPLRTVPTAIQTMSTRSKSATDDRLSVLDLRPMLTRAATQRSTSTAHVTPRELDHALTRRRLLH